MLVVTGVTAVNSRSLVAFLSFLKVHKRHKLQPVTDKQINKRQTSIPKE